MRYSSECLLHFGSVPPQCNSVGVIGCLGTVHKCPSGFHSEGVSQTDEYGHTPHCSAVNSHALTERHISCDIISPSPHIYHWDASCGYKASNHVSHLLRRHSSALSWLNAQEPDVREHNTVSSSKHAGDSVHVSVAYQARRPLLRFARTRSNPMERRKRLIIN